MDAYAAIEHLKRIGGNFEAYRVYTFRCSRRARDGRDHMITVEVWDAGPIREGPRYVCVARSDDGKAASGNSHDDWRTAMTVVHWEDLD